MRNEKIMGLVQDMEEVDPRILELNKKMCAVMNGYTYREIAEVLLNVVGTIAYQNAKGDYTIFHEALERFDRAICEMVNDSKELHKIMKEDMDKIQEILKEELEKEPK